MGRRATYAGFAATTIPSRFQAGPAGPTGPSGPVPVYYYDENADEIAFNDTEAILLIGPVEVQTPNSPQIIQYSVIVNAFKDGITGGVSLYLAVDALAPTSIADLVIDANKKFQISAQGQLQLSTSSPHTLGFLIGGDSGAGGGSVGVGQATVIVVAPGQG